MDERQQIELVQQLSVGKKLFGVDRAQTYLKTKSSVTADLEDIKKSIMTTNKMGGYNRYQ